jgi:threonine synthase
LAEYDYDRLAREVALGALRASDGLAVAVTDAEIRQAMVILPRRAVVEPSGSVGVAGQRRLVASGRVARDACVVCVLALASRISSACWR